MILVDIGEIGVTTGANFYKLRPSLYAISQLGTPEEILALYESLMGTEPRLLDALAVIHACAEEDVSDAFGCLVPARAGGAKGVRYKPGEARVMDMLIIARSLLRHGVTGALPPEPVDDDTPEAEGFDARAYVSLAMAHLGASSRDAWAMTMTELVGAMRAKFPPTKEGSPRMTAEEYEATMDWADRVEEARRKQHGK